MGAKTTYVQSNMTVGEVSPTLHARIDINKYYNGLSKAQNVTILPHGGVRRRPGMRKVTDSLVPGNARIFEFEFSTTQDYLIILYPSFVRILKDGVQVYEGASPYTTFEEIQLVDVIQSADTMIFTLETITPYRLQRQGSDTSWLMDAVPLINIPTYDFGAGAEPVWSATRGYPGVCTFHQGRLVLAGSTSKPNSVWGSKINSFFDFDIGTGQADFAIFDTLDSDQYNKIQSVFSGRSLQVFTSGSEFYNTADVWTPETSAWKRTTGYGTRRLRPILIDGATLFVDRSGRTLRSFLYSFEEDGYVSPSANLMSSHLFSGAVALDAVKGTEADVSDLVYVVNDDGTVAVMNTMRAEQIQGWTHWTTEGTFKDVAVVNKQVYFFVQRGNEYFIEVLDERTTTDHNSYYDGAPADVDNVAHSGDNVVSNGDNIIHTVPGTGTPTTTIDTDTTTAMEARTYKVLADNSVMEDSVGGLITIPRPAFYLEAGLDVPVVVRTLPLNVNGAAGATINLRKRVIRVMLNLVDSLGVYAQNKYFSDRKFTVTLDQAPDLYTGLKEIYLLGYGRIVEIELTQDDPLPLTLIGFGWEVEL